jgi:hypothetical protein
MTLDMGPVTLESLSPYLSKVSKNAPIGCRMQPGQQFEYGQLLDELDFVY